MSPATLDSTALYRLPWTLTDNGISWLEPTDACNLSCDGCYRKNAPVHKPLDVVKTELDTFQRLRRSDCISIAGGDPLLYPDLTDLVAEIRRRGLKPIVNTNGVALTPELLRELARAGVFGFTFHVDSRQNRQGFWAGKNDVELNALRHHYARMVHDAGDIAVSFNATVYEENLEHVPAMVDWAQRHIDLVQTMVFICFRHVVPGLDFDWYAHDRKVDWDQIWYHSEQDRTVSIDSPALVARLREGDARFAPAAYLNGTEDPTACKWLLTQRVGTPEHIYGYLGPRFVELLMTGYHLLRGRYLAYVAPSTARRARIAMAVGGLVDAGSRRAGRSYLRALLTSLGAWRHGPRLQSLMFIQPIDLQADGRQSMCDGCPDITVHDGKLVWSCRLEELKEYGTFLRTVPRDGRESQAPTAAAPVEGEAEG